ncbi:hypothetical protein C4546_03620 [Candidatus Parcubacteria bacterium]|jgi:hypothetical protein|nr:MAG: hypothetical protein C4546_03620 [Candidatus Parcubacteria bacterium]
MLWRVLEKLLVISGLLFWLGIFAILNPQITKSLVTRFIPTPPPAPQTQVIYSQIPLEEFTPEYINQVLAMQVSVGDSLDQVYGLKKEGLLKSGIVWFGISSYTNSVFTFFDYYLNCGCGPGVVSLTRLAPVDRKTLRPIVQKKMLWEAYFFSEPEDTSFSSSM